MLQSLQVHKATGPDGLSARLLKTAGAELASVFTVFFRHP